MKLVFMLISLLFCLNACTKDNINEKDNGPEVITEFTDIAHLKQKLLEYASIEDVLVRDSIVNSFFYRMKEEGKIPFAKGDSVLFLAYNRTASSIVWAGDFNGWKYLPDEWGGIQIGGSGIWMMEKSFPSDARLDYKLIVNGSNWQLDKYNKHIQYSGFGPNSELRMPDWIFPEETVLGPGVNRGTLSPDIIMSSEHLGYDIQYRVYLPYDHEKYKDLPVVYVTDGHEYADNSLGALLIITDNLIHSKKIKPIILVLIDPRNPNNLSQNRRADQYRSNPKFLSFVADELVPKIDEIYNTSKLSSERAILGTSLGGWNSAYFGVNRSEVFGLLCIHSPAIDVSIPSAFQNSDLLPLKIYLSTGVIFDTHSNAMILKNIFNEKGYDFLYREVNQGHSWGNWRGLIAEPFMFFFGI